MGFEFSRFKTIRLEFSSISQLRKIQGLQKWKIQWNLFIDYSYRLACQQ
jgi:hypothetical protein